MWKGEVWLVRKESLQKIGTFKRKERLEIDSEAVGSVSCETVDRLASVEDETSTVHVTHVGKSKEPENATSSLTRLEKKLYDMCKLLEDSESETDQSSSEDDDDSDTVFEVEENLVGHRIIDVEILKPLHREKKSVLTPADSYFNLKRASVTYVHGKVFDQLNPAPLLTHWGTAWEVKWYILGENGQILRRGINYRMCKLVIFFFFFEEEEDVGVGMGVGGWWVELGSIWLINNCHAAVQKRRFVFFCRFFFSSLLIRGLRTSRSSSSSPSSSSGSRTVGTLMKDHRDDRPPVFYDHSPRSRPLIFPPWWTHKLLEF